METTNEIRRLKAKLKLFEEEGFNWVMYDFIEHIVPMEIEMKDVMQTIDYIKKRYLKQLEELSPPNIKQSKLEL